MVAHIGRLLLKLLALLQTVWRSLSRQLSREELRWREVPPEGVAPLLEDLRPTTRRTYLGLLSDFAAYAGLKGLPLGSRTEVDLAAYAYIGDHSKSKGENLVAALHRCYPLLRSHLRWAVARLKVVSASTVVHHHKPMHWLVAVAIAWRCVLGGQPRHAAVILLQWRFGLRPTEALRLCGGDLHSHWLRPAGDGDVTYIMVGALRGTKAGRPQVVRARPSDRMAQFLVWLLASSTPAGAYLSDIRDTQKLQKVFSLRLSQAGIAERYTPHCPRAGWATTRHTRGQPFADLREDGRWRSDNSLRIYLDVVANQQTLDTPDIVAQLPFLRHLAATIEQWLVL